MLFYNLIPKGGAFAPPFDNPSRVIACCLRGSYPQTGVQGGVVPSEHRPGPPEPAGETGVGFIEASPRSKARRGWAPQCLCAGGGWILPLYNENCPRAKKDRGQR